MSTLLRYPVTLRAVTEQDGRLACRAVDSQGGDFPFWITLYQNGAVGVCLGAPQTPDADFVQPECRTVTQALTLHESESRWTGSLPGGALALDKDPYRLTLFNKDGVAVYQDQMNDVNPVGSGQNIIPPFGFTRDQENITQVNLCARLRPDEQIYGLGERFGELSKRGQCIEMINTDTLGCRDRTAYKNVPFYISSHGYGLFVNTQQIARFSVGHDSNNSLSVSVPGQAAEYFLLPGKPAEVLSAFVKMTGPAALPPDWSFGLWYSTAFQSSNQEQALIHARRFRDEGIPCDVFHLDCYWMKENHWCNFVWDRETYPDPEAMIRQLHEMNYKLCVWINPYVSMEAPEFAQWEPYFVKNAQGETYLEDLWHGLLPLCAFVDFTNPVAVTWYQGKIEELLRQGVDIVKTDFAEDIPLDARFYNGKTGAEMRNLYARLYNEAVTDKIRLVRGTNEAMVWARSGYAGMQRVPVCWSGDPRSTWEGMAATLRGGLSAAMSGILFWSHDMGGFYGEVTDEVYIRWSQMGLFSSHSRLHGTTSRAPWDFSPRAHAVLKETILLRYRYMDYILRTARECVDKGLPFIAPLMLYHMDDLTARTVWDTYYFGRDMIAVPVFDGDNARRMFYLPEGRWVCQHTGAVYEGRQWHAMNVALERIPLFAREGAQVL